MTSDRMTEIEQLKRAVLLKRLQQKNAARQGVNTSTTLVGVSREERMPLSFSQQRLWFLDQLDVDASVAYQIRAALRLSGTLDTTALKKALDGIVARHEVLRTRFEAEQGTPYQVIEEADCGFELEHSDLSVLAPDDRENELAATIDRESARGFDLRRGPLVRGLLIRIGGQEWVLWIAQHHIVSDAWSVGILIAELNQLYAAAVEGRDTELPPLPIQYADYASWQHDRQRNGEMQSHLEYWRQHLADAPALLEMPLDRPRRQTRSFSGALLKVELSTALSEGLRALSRHHGVTLFMTLLASWAALMSRLSGQEDVVIGTPFANRTRRELEPLLGFFVNTLALRLRVGVHADCAHLLAQARDVTLSGYSHAEFPFDHVVEALRPTRSNSHSPLFQTMLALDSTGSDQRLRLPGLDASILPLPYRATHYDLTLSLDDSNLEIVGSLGYSTELFNHGTVQRFLDCWVHLLEGMVANADCRIARLPLLGTAGKGRVSQAAIAHGKDISIDELVPVHLQFAYWASTQPDAVAVECGNQSWSYADVDARAEALAQRLRQRGVGPDAIVGLCVERSLQMVVGVLGILKSGAAYLPLDPAYPSDRLNHMISDSGLIMLVREAATAAIFSPPSVPTLVIDEGAGPFQTGIAPALVHAEQSAYVIYTSGSTGLPKGVLVPHRGLSNVISAYRGAFPLQPGHRVLHFVSLSFDAASAHLFLALCSGATVCIHDRNASDSRELTTVLRSECIHYVGLPVSVLSAMSCADLPDLRFISTGTEACPMQLVERWGQGRRFVNIYGPTEASICSTLSVFDPSRICDELERPPIGKPIQATRVYVLDRELQPVPVGVVGELFIAGFGVARGYLRQPALTAERFLPDPFTADLGARMYRTGDLVRMLESGELDFVGRRDGQVKLRGFRIELGEVEAALRRHAGVHAAAAAIVDAGTDLARLVGYVVAPEGVVDAVIESLRRSLPAHLVPASVMRIERLPLNANGKLDRAALPIPPIGTSDVDGKDTSEGDIARKIASIWCDLLRREQVSAQANFFELGGHSLLATQLVARINQQFSTALPLKLVFDTPVLSAMAARIESTLDRQANVNEQYLGLTSASEITPVATPEGTEKPLSFAQQRLWFLEQMNPGDAGYHIPGALRLRGELDVEALQRTFDALVARHAILRTRFVDHDGTPMQVIDPDVRLSMDRHQVAPADLSEWQASAARQTFDFNSAPLLRTTLLHLSEREHVLLVNMHHIISDGWSLGVLINELATLYRSEVSGIPSALPELALHYADFAHWQRSWLAGGEMDRQLAFWRERLRALPPLLELPCDYPRPRERSGAGAIVEFTLPADVVSALRTLCQRESVTLFMALLAAFKVLLARLTGETDIFVGTLVANRTRVEFEPLIGFFVNTLVLRNEVNQEQDFLTFLAQVRTSTLDAYAHQDVPFEQLVETLRPARSLAYTPLFQVLCSMQNTPGEALVLPELDVEILPSELGISKFDMALDFKEVGGQVHGEFEYATDLFSASTIACWIEAFSYLVAAIAKQPDLPIHSIPLCEPSAARKFQDRWQGELRPLREPACVPAQVIAQAAIRPHAPAYIGSGQTLSYGELDRRSNQLAHELRKQGVQDEGVVGVCMPRGPELAVAILAIWKAGAVYLPMDLEYPSARLAYMLRDADAQLVLAEASFNNRELPWGNVAWLDPREGSISQQPDTPLVTRWHPASLAYVIYTSGSTGVPKGVQVDHRALAHHCNGAVTAYGLCSDDRVLHFAALGFDISLDQLLPTWAAGATAVARDRELWSPRELAEKLVEFDITVADLPSALWHMVAKEWSEEADTPVNPRLRLFLVGGEAMASESLRHWRRTPYASTPLLNGYGPTETTITSSGHWCVADTATVTVPIGRPFANRRFLVLDERLQLLPPGFPGELYIAGEGLARGYRGQPGQTASVFLPDPYAPQGNSGRMYRSGDKVRFHSDGTLEFLGRIDDQVKLQGHRIELEEVESALRALPGVRDAAATVRIIANGDRRLVGYLLLETGIMIDSKVLRQQLARDLPGHLVPSILMEIDDLPTINGKIRRQALPTPETIEDDHFVAARNRTEAWLASVWAELLGLPQVGVESDFFALGGHSLLATQLLARVRRHFGVMVPLRQLFDAPSIAEMAAQIDALMEIKQMRDDSVVDALQAREEIEL